MGGPVEGKYPRTFHLPDSPGATAGDQVQPIGALGSAGPPCASAGAAVSTAARMMAFSARMTAQ